MSKQINQRFRSLTIGEALATSYDFPLTTGAEDQVLKVDGSGNLVFGAASAGEEGLAATLAIDNTSGTYSIIMETTTAITSANGGGQIDLDVYGSADAVFISTDNALWNGDKQGLYLADGGVELFDGSSPTGRYSNLQFYEGNAKLGTDGGIKLQSHTQLDLMTQNSTGFSSNIQIMDNSAGAKSSNDPAGTPHFNAVFINSDNSSAGSGVNNSVIIGGAGLASTQDNTVYVPKFNVSTLNGTTATTLLAVDANGNVVDGSAIAGGGEETTADNGLTLTGATVSLGGTLNANTTIDGSTGTYNLDLSNLNDFNVNSDGVFTLDADNGNQIAMNDSGWLAITSDAGAYGESYIAIDAAGTAIELASTGGTLKLGVATTPKIDITSNAGNYVVIDDAAGVPVSSHSNGALDIDADGILTIGSDVETKVAYIGQVIDTGSETFPMTIGNRGSVDVGEVTIVASGRTFKQGLNDTTGATPSHFPTIAMVDGDVVSIRVSTSAMDRTRTKGYAAELFATYKKIGGAITRVGTTDDLRENSDYSTASIASTIDAAAGVRVTVTGEAATFIGWKIDYDYNVDNFNV